MFLTFRRCHCRLNAWTLMQELAMLGQHLLSDSLGEAAAQAGSGAPGSFATTNNIPTEVLVTAARQHLMSAEALQLQIPHVALLLADYQQLAASYHAHLMLSRWVRDAACMCAFVGMEVH